MISIVLFVLGRGIKAGNKLDSFIRDCLEKLGENYIVKISILNSKPCFCFWREGKKVYFKVGSKARRIKADLEISFKNKKSAKDVLFGGISIYNAFADHYFIVNGDISKAMLVVPMLENLEVYLLPRFMTRDIITETQKQVSSFRFYLFVLLSL